MTVEIPSEKEAMRGGRPANSLQRPTAVSRPASHQSLGITDYRPKRQEPVRNRSLTGVPRHCTSSIPQGGRPDIVRGSSNRGHSGRSCRFPQGQFLRLHLPNSHNCWGSPQRRRTFRFIALPASEAPADGANFGRTVIFRAIVVITRTSLPGVIPAVILEHTPGARS